MSKVNLPSVPGGYLSVQALNSRFAAIATAFENTVSRDGTLPNFLTSDLDFNGRNALNIDKLEAQNVMYNGVDINDGLNYFTDNYPSWPDEYDTALIARDETLAARDITLASEQNVISLEDSTRIYSLEALVYKEEAEQAAATSTIIQSDVQGNVSAAEQIFETVSEAQAQTNALLGLGIGSSYVDANGDLFISYYSASVSDVYINQDGYLTLEYE